MRLLCVPKSRYWSILCIPHMFARPRGCRSFVNASFPTALLKETDRCPRPNSAAILGLVLLPIAPVLPGRKTAWTCGFSWNTGSPIVPFVAHHGESSRKSKAKRSSLTDSEELEPLSYLIVRERWLSCNFGSLNPNKIYTSTIKLDPHNTREKQFCAILTIVIVDSLFRIRLSLLEDEYFSHRKHRYWENLQWRPSTVPPKKLHKTLENIDTSTCA